jgi:hypothetical protein
MSAKPLLNNLFFRFLRDDILHYSSWLKSTEYINFKLRTLNFKLLWLTTNAMPLRQPIGNPWLIFGAEDAHQPQALVSCCFFYYVVRRLRAFAVLSLLPIVNYDLLCVSRKG